MELILKSYPKKGWSAYAALIDKEASKNQGKVVVDIYDNGTPIDHKGRNDCYRLAGGGKFHYCRFYLSDGDYRINESQGFGTRFGDNYFIRIKDGEIGESWDTPQEYLKSLHFGEQPELPKIEGVSRNQIKYAESVRDRAIARNPDLLSYFLTETSARNILDQKDEFN
jgi:hypothetical protein